MEPGPFLGVCRTGKDKQPLFLSLVYLAPDISADIPAIRREAWEPAHPAPTWDQSPCGSVPRRQRQAAWCFWRLDWRFPSFHSPWPPVSKPRWHREDVISAKRPRYALILHKRIAHNWKKVSVSTWKYDNLNRQNVKEPVGKKQER